MHAVLQDLRYAARVLLRSPGFTVVAAATLALGIGANTAMFSVIRGILLKPLPYTEPDRLFRVYEESVPGVPEFPVSPGNFLDYRRESQSFEALAAYQREDLQLGGDRPEQLRGMRVTAGFFALLGYSAALGREFTAADERWRARCRRAEPHAVDPPIQWRPEYPRPHRPALRASIRRHWRTSAGYSTRGRYVSHVSTR